MSRLQEVVEKYQNVMKNEFEGCVGTFDRSNIGRDGVGNRKFYIMLFSSEELSLDFLLDSGLLKKEVICPKCGDNMHLKETTVTSDKVRWECNRKSRAQTCRTRRSLRLQSLFSRSKLSLGEVMNLTYEVINGTENKEIIREYGFSEHTVCDWRGFIREQLMEYTQRTSEQIGGPNVVVEVDLSKFARRKSAKGRQEESHWVFGGLERQTGKCFFVAIEDCTESSLISAIQDWIKPGTTITSDSWASYSPLSPNGFNHLKANYSISFVDEITRERTNATDSSWSPVKTKLSDKSRLKKYFTGHLASYLFEKQCKIKDVDQFNTFLEIVREVTF